MKFKSAAQMQPMYKAAATSMTDIIHSGRPSRWRPHPSATTSSTLRDFLRLRNDSQRFPAVASTPNDSIITNNVHPGFGIQECFGRFCHAKKIIEAAPTATKANRIRRFISLPNVSDQPRAKRVGCDDWLGSSFFRLIRAAK